MAKPVPDLIKNLPKGMVFHDSTRMIDAYENFRMIADIDAFQYFFRTPFLYYEHWLKTNMFYSYDADYYVMKKNINNEISEWFCENISCWMYFRVKSKMMRLYFIDENEMLLFRLRLG